MRDGRAGVALAAWLATMTAAFAMTPLVQGAAWLVQAGALLAAQTGTGMLLRWRGTRSGPAVLAQLLVSLVLLTAVTAREYALYGFLPGQEVFARFGRLLTAGAEDVGRYVAPAPATDGITLMLFGGVLLIGLLVDLLAVTLRSAASAGLPLLALYSVAAGVAEDDAGWPFFLCAATGYLLLLLTEGRGRLSAWGRFFAGPPSGHPAAPPSSPPPAPASPAARPSAPPVPPPLRRPAGPRVRTGRRIGALTLGVAVLAPAVLPSLGDGLLDLDARRSGGGSGPGDINVNPVVALEDQLNQPYNRTVLRYTTDSEDARQMYLRLVALDEFTGEEWRSSRSLEDVPGTPWPVDGLSSGVATEQATTVITADDSYAQSSLPVPYPATSVEAVGGWRYDPGSQTLASGGRPTSEGATYRVEHLLVEPAPEQLAGAPPAPAEVRERFTEVPDGLPTAVEDLARVQTAGAANDYERGVALQEWFTQEGGFRYDTSVESGSGNQAVVDFLDRREGFCVHFAFTMAAMARTLGIPAQVAVGFTPGRLQADGFYEVGLHNAHAWPELYFEGVGWTRFEPTPGQGSTPPYTLPEADRSGQDPDRAEPERPEEADPQPTPSPSAGVPEECDPAGGTGECAQAPQTPESGAGEDAVPLWRLLSAGGGGLLLAAAAAGPLLWRRRVRARRLAPGAGPLPAWQELNDTAWDFGILPVASETPRQAARRIASAGRLGAEATAAALRVAGVVEEQLYASAPRHEEELGGEVRKVCAALGASAGRAARLRALLLPRSAHRVTDAARERWTSAVRWLRAGFRLRRRQASRKGA